MPLQMMKGKAGEANRRSPSNRTVSLSFVLRLIFALAILCSIGYVGRMTYWLFSSSELLAVDPAALVPHTQHTWSNDSPCHTYLKQQKNSTYVAPQHHKRFVCMGKSRYSICPTTSPQPSNNNNNITAASSRPPRIAVAVIAARRAEYFSRLLQSLENQQETESIRTDIHIFVDRCQGNERVLDLAQQHTAAASPLHTTTSTTLHSNFTTNQGVARLTWAAMEMAFGTHTGASSESYYDQLILLEEDHVIGPNYISTLSRLLTLSDRMDSIGVVSGNLLNYTAHQTNKRVHVEDSCQYQVLPLDGFTDLSSHNIWAWGMSRSKFLRMRNVYENGLVTTGLLRRPYHARDTQRIARWMRRTCGRYRHWQGQDWVRACAMAAAGMPYKLQTVERTLQYIGVTGLHSTNETFTAKQYSTEFPVATQRLDYAENDMCERLCYSDMVTVVA